MTNRDKLFAMSDEELAEELSGMCSHCQYKNTFYWKDTDVRVKDNNPVYWRSYENCRGMKCKKGILEWLKADPFETPEQQYERLVSEKDKDLKEAMEKHSFELSLNEDKTEETKTENKTLLDIIGA